MYGKFFNSLHLLNIVFQAFYTLAVPIGIGALASYLLTKHTSVGGWIWAVLLLMGVLIGLFSMVKFILTATAGLERMEKQQKERLDAMKEKEKKQDELRSLGKSQKFEGNNNER